LRHRPRRGGASADPALSERTNTEALGNVLYTDYIFFFQMAGLVLLVAMIGAIVLTLRHKEGVKRQNINRAGRADARTAIEVVKVKPGQNGGSEGIMMEIGLPITSPSRDPVHARRFRHLPEPQERHHHPDVDRTDPACGQHQPGGVLVVLNDMVGQVFALLILTVAAAEAAIGLAILVVFFRNRGSIAVEDINMMKG
jgi:hypothetical protein